MVQNLQESRTLARFLDAVNFTGNTNPYGTPDPTAEFPQEIYFLDRKVTENRNVVTWEAQSALDLVSCKTTRKNCNERTISWYWSV